MNQTAAPRAKPRRAAPDDPAGRRAGAPRSLEFAPDQVVAWASEHPSGYLVAAHKHERAQLLCPLSGVVMVATEQGRWMVPSEHALWIPDGIEHSVEMLGDVDMRSVYVAPVAGNGLPEHVRVVGLTDLMRSLMVEAVSAPTRYSPQSRAALIMALILEEIPRLPEKRLGLPFPANPRIAELCRRFIEAPSSGAPIDDWADALAMSRRAFTRAFRRETGLSLSTWRQQCCLFAALPRLAAGEPVTGVALDLGYDSVAAFTTMFKRMLGAPPRRYLRESANEARAGFLAV